MLQWVETASIDKGDKDVYSSNPESNCRTHPDADFLSRYCRCHRKCNIEVEGGIGRFALYVLISLSITARAKPESHVDCRAEQ